MKKLLSIIFAGVAVFIAAASCSEAPATGNGSSLKVTALKCENLADPLAIDSASPHFSYKLVSAIDGDSQTAYEIQVASSAKKLARGKADLWKSGKVDSDESIMIPYGGKTLVPGQLCWWRVRSWDSKGNPSEWSPAARFGTGFFEGMEGEYIGMEGEKSLLVRKKTTVPGGRTVLVTVNSLGYHELYVNGSPASDYVLTPAVTQLTKRSLSVTYDISSLIRDGLADICIWAGEGWFKKKVFKDLPCEGPLVKAVVSVADGKGRLKVTDRTDGSWVCSPGGYVDNGTWEALGFDGEKVDGTVIPSDMTAQSLDARQWTEAKVTKVEGITCTPQMCEPNRIIESFPPVKTERLADGSWLIDIGKDITGWFELTMEGLEKGQEVLLEYTDHIDAGEEFECQRAHDVYVAAGKDREVFCNKFNYKAYRFVRISNLSSVPVARALQISGAYAPASTFECSDSDLNAVHNLINRTFRVLAYSGYMVDCPHYERLGYGGDGNASTMSIQTMYDVAPLYYNWLQAWGDVIHEDGSLPHTAPEYFAGGGPYWCAFIVKAPWRTLLSFGDDRMVRLRYEDMKKWLTYVDKYTTDGLLGRWPDTPYRQWFLGDWIPPRDIGIDPRNERSVSLIANCVVSDVMATMTRIASYLGKDDEAAMFSERRDRTNKLIHEKFYNEKDNTYGSGSPTDISYAMLVGAVPPSLHDSVRDNLVRLSYGKYRGHIAVGLTGVPIFTEWCVKNRQADLMATILRQKDYPGYLYMIENGGTATWEDWDGGDRHRGSRMHNCYNGIGTWFYQAVGGIVPDEDSPGYRHFFLDPQFPEGVSWAKVTKETPYGTVSVRWEKKDGRTQIEAELPVGVTASFKSPVEGGDQLLRSGKTQITIK